MIFCLSIGGCGGSTDRSIGSQINGTVLLTPLCSTVTRYTVLLTSICDSPNSILGIKTGISSPASTLNRKIEQKNMHYLLVKKDYSSFPQILRQAVVHCCSDYYSQSANLDKYEYLINGLTSYNIIIIVIICLIYQAYYLAFMSS